MEESACYSDDFLSPSEETGNAPQEAKQKKKKDVDHAPEKKKKKKSVDHSSTDEGQSRRKSSAGMENGTLDKEGKKPKKRKGSRNLSTDGEQLSPADSSTDASMEGDDVKGKKGRKLSTSSATDGASPGTKKKKKDRKDRKGSRISVESAGLPSPDPSDAAPESDAQNELSLQTQTSPDPAAPTPGESAPATGTASGSEPASGAERLQTSSAPAASNAPSPEVSGGADAGTSTPGAHGTNNAEDYNTPASMSFSRKDSSPWDNNSMPYSPGASPRSVERRSSQASSRGRSPSRPRTDDSTQYSLQYSDYSPDSSLRMSRRATSQSPLNSSRKAHTSEPPPDMEPLSLLVQATGAQPLDGMDCLRKFVELKPRSAAQEAYLQTCESRPGYRPPRNEERSKIRVLESTQGHSCRTLYLHYCKEYSVISNSALLKTLPEVVDMFNMKSMVLADNFIGDRGLLPVLEVCRANTSLQSLVLPNNGLKASGVEAIVDMCATHPSIQTLDLRGNKHVSILSAKTLQYLVTHNLNICGLHLDGTRITPGYMQRLSRLVEANSQRKQPAV